MKEIYFVRHAQSDARVTDSERRPLTDKGLKDRESLIAYFRPIKIDRILSSPYRRAVETLLPLAQQRGLTIVKNAAFREWNGGRPFPGEEFERRMRALWADFSHQTGGCESLHTLARRAVSGLSEALHAGGDSIVIGGHGVMMTAVIHHFYPLFDVERFFAMLPLAPWIAKMYFDGNQCAGMAFTDPMNAACEGGGRIRGIRICETGALGAYRYVVVFARCDGKWVFARAKTRDGFETAGGHIENGESPLNAARRELYEETGALDFSMLPLFDYAVDCENEYANGQVFFADIRRLGPLPDFEMAEIRLTDNLPEKLRFPEILPELYKNALCALAEKGESHL